MGKKHWMTWTRFHSIWRNMIARCKYGYKNYWGRWITFEPKWKVFINFYNDMHESYNDTLSLERIDNNWNYCKNNCRWATRKEQSSNRRNTIFYKWMTLKDYCKSKWLAYKTIHARYKYYWYTLEEAIAWTVIPYELRKWFNS